MPILGWTIPEIVKSQAFKVERSKWPMGSRRLRQFHLNLRCFSFLFYTNSVQIFSWKKSRAVSYYTWERVPCSAPRVQIWGVFLTSINWAEPIMRAVFLTGPARSLRAARFSSDRRRRRVHHQSDSLDLSRTMVLSLQSTREFIIITALSDVLIVLWFCSELSKYGMRLVSCQLMVCKKN